MLNEPVSTATPPTPQPERSFGNDAGGLVNANPQRPNLAPQVANATKRNPPGNTPGPQHGPKPSSASHEAIDNASKAVSKLPQKRSLADTLMEIQRYVISALLLSFLICFVARILQPKTLKIEAASTLSCVSKLLMR